MADYVKIPEVAQLLGLSEKTVRRRVKAGEIPSVFIGGVYRISRAELEEYLDSAKVRPGKVQAPPSPELSLFNGREEERRGKLVELKSFINKYAFVRADYWEQELERGHAKEYATADAAYNLAVLAADDFSSIHSWLFDHGPARPLREALDQGAGLEIAEEYDALIDALIERTTRTQRMLFANAERLAETEAKRNQIAAKHREADATLNANAGRHIA